LHGTRLQRGEIPESWLTPFKNDGVGNYDEWTLVMLTPRLKQIVFAPEKSVKLRYQARALIWKPFKNIAHLKELRRNPKKTVMCLRILQTHTPYTATRFRQRCFHEAVFTQKCLGVLAIWSGMCTMQPVHVAAQVSHIWAEAPTQATATHPSAHRPPPTAAPLLMVEAPTEAAIFADDSLVTL
jgi:hypothetical protein